MKLLNTNHKYTNSDSVRMCIDFSIHDFQYAHVSLVSPIKNKESRSYARNNKMHIQVSQ